MNKSHVSAVVVAVISAVFVALPGVGMATVASAPIMNHPISPVRLPDGKVARGPHNSMISSNWSGYAVAQYQTGQSYTSAQGEWKVPTVSGAPTPGYSSSWVGIGGFCMNARCGRVDNSLIQLGTEQDISSSGVVSYYAWYEMLPQAETVITNFAVNPGDTIVATLALQSSAGVTAGVTRDAKGGNSGHGGSGSGGGKSGGGKTSSSGTWLLTLTDATTNATWSKTVSYKSSLASAEWIEEAPYEGGILPLADYGIATFDPNTANGANPGLVSSDMITMSNPNGQVSVPSVPDSNTDGFNTCWGANSNTTSCAAPTF